MNQFIGIPIELLFSIIGALGIYIFIDHKKQVEKEFTVLKGDLLETKKKIDKIETGEFVEKIVKNTIYSPESREYFKNLFKEALAHQRRNEEVPWQHVFDRLDEIEKKIK